MLWPAPRPSLWATTLLFGVASLTACAGLTDSERFHTCATCGDADVNAEVGEAGGMSDGAPSHADVRTVDPDDATVCGDGAICDDKNACTQNVCGAAGCEFPLLIDNDGDKHVSAALGLGCADDCDDGDPKVFPGQTSWFAYHSELADFDYDCNGVAEKRWPDLGSCSGSGSPCTVKEGWLDKVAGCGVTSKWLTACALESGKCVPSTAVVKVQECH